MPKDAKASGRLRVVPGVLQDEYRRLLIGVYRNTPDYARIAEYDLRHKWWMKIVMAHGRGIAEHLTFWPAFEQVFYRERFLASAGEAHDSAIVGYGEKLHSIVANTLRLRGEDGRAAAWAIEFIHADVSAGLPDKDVSGRRVLYEPGGSAMLTSNEVTLRIEVDPWGASLRLVEDSKTRDKRNIRARRFLDKDEWDALVQEAADVISCWGATVRQEWDEIYPRINQAREDSKRADIELLCRFLFARPSKTIVLTRKERARLRERCKILGLQLPGAQKNKIG